MSSILTNNGAMVALQTLQSINKNLGSVQSQISTGKSVANAKDNSAVWSISKQMDSDVQGFKAISESLNLGESTVSTARSAAETVTDLLTQMKGKIVAAQEENVDRGKIQADIDALEEQIGAVVGGAQFNGLNLINGETSEDMNVLASLNRNADGTVSKTEIAVERQNLSVTEPVTAATFGGAAADQDAANALMQSGAINTRFDANPTTGDEFDFTGTAGTDFAADIADGGTFTIDIKSVTEGASYQITLNDVNVNVAGGGETLGQRTFEYVAGSGDGTSDVAKNLTSQINAFFGAATNGAEGYSVAQGTGTDADQITITNGAGGTATAMQVGLRAGEGGTPGSSPATGGLGAVANIDVTSDAGATGALAVIDELIDKSIDAAAAFGSVQGRIETQSDFVSKITDNLTSGIGSLVDANMEETSARLQALQVQQQLATQSLSIANQAPQNILSLFR
jgi:flagellin